jgi:hypothetical protein
MVYSTARIVGIVFIIISLLSFLAGIIITPDLVESRLSDDHDLKPGTVKRIQDARRTTFILGILAAIAAIPLLVRPGIARSDKNLAI